MFKHILLAADGQPHTGKAVELCLKIAKKSGCSLSIIHVMDPYLKQFYNEIYAQGRKQYLEHVDACLKNEAEELEKNLRKVFEPAVSDLSFVKAYGDPETEILKLLDTGTYDLLVTGGKLLAGIKKITSWNLPTRLEMKSPGVPVLVCRK